MAREQHDGGAVGPGGEGDARIGGRAEGRSDPGDDLKGDSGRGQSGRLLAPAPEYEWIAALEPDDRLSLKRQPHKGLVDLALGPAELPALLSREHALAIRPGHVEEPGGDQVVVHHDIRLAQHPAGLEREELGIPGPGSDKVHDAGAHMSAPASACSEGRARLSAICVSRSIESLADSRSVLSSRSGARGGS